jgi:2,4-dienoyl-CoA reductase-like NADH-dependent reductase (Old Yellow Enzyme family)
MSQLFQAASIGAMRLRNRFVRSATHEGMAAHSGEATEALVDLYRELAKGGVGLAISGFAFVDKRGKAAPGMLGAHDDAVIPGLARLARSVHDCGGACALQIVHCGALGRFDTGLPREAPSAVENRATRAMPVAMSAGDIRRVVEGFGQAARRAREAGFDAVQIHAAHGYLISQFLSPYSNVRNDEYGGPIANRARFLFEVYEAVRDRVGDEFPVLTKINVCDFDEGGLSSEDSLWVCRKLSEMGIDAIELSGGTPASGSLGPTRFRINRPEKEAYFRDYARSFQPGLACPVILVGGLRSLEVMEELFGEGAAQFFSMSRPLISEPDLVNRWQSGRTERARCISCSRCFGSAAKTGRLHCVTHNEPA